METRSNKLVHMLIGISLVFLFIILVVQIFRTSPGKITPVMETGRDEGVRLLSGEDSPSPSAQEPHYYVIKAKDEMELQFRQITHALQYAKLGYTVIEEREVATLAPSPFTFVITTSEQMDNQYLPDFQRFVEGGGNLYISKRFLDPQWNSLVGIEETAGFEEENRYGMTSVGDWNFIYEELDSKNDFFVNYSLDVSLKDNSEVFLTSEGAPLFWTYEYGEGNVGYWNGTWLASKSSRGLFLQTLGLLPERMVSGIAGIKTFFIDDFPAPFIQEWGEKNNEMEETYRMPPPQFYKEVWWQDMKEIAKTHDLLYTNVMIGSYEDAVNYNSSELVNKNSKELLYYARDSIQHNHELGLHGYNHQSLVTADEKIDRDLGYIPWKNKQEMKNSLKIMNDLLHAYFPSSDYHTYVPPSNVLKKTGLQAVQEALPSIEVLASVYDGGIIGSYVQEIGTDPDYPQMFHLPRFSSGYHQSDATRYGANDALANLGMINHFVHPDDLLDMERSDNKSWNVLKEEFERFLMDKEEAFPVLKPYTAKDAAKYMKAYLAGELRVNHLVDSIIIEGDRLPSPSRLFIRLNSGERIKEEKTDDYTIYPIGESSNVYQVSIETLPVEIHLER
ncbi:DUF2194 domain-containing protein [Bacillus sp. RO3]|nr:DUF2194 domain-containing protein [Bacillus sp. RO3]